MKFILSYEFLKRKIDILFALLMIIILSPLLILIYLLIFFLDNGPVIFKQLRVGKNGKYFMIYKLIKPWKFGYTLTKVMSEIAYSEEKKCADNKSHNLS